MAVFWKGRWQFPSWAYYALSRFRAFFGFPPLFLLRTAPLRWAYRSFLGLTQLLILLALLAFAYSYFANSPWPFGTTVRHILAFPNCSAARALGFEATYRGEPGYWPKHDADKDGIACEPYPGGTSGHRRGFIRRK